MAIFNEDTRVKIPATIQFLRLGYNYQSLKTDDVDIDFNTKIFVNRFKPALERINGRDFTYDEIKSILTDIHNILKNNDLGKEFYNWLIDPLDKVKLIDFDINVPISILSTLKLKDGEFSLDDYMEFFDLEEISFFASFNWLIDYDTYKNFSETELEIAISKVQKIINELEVKNVNNEFSIEVEKYKYMLDDINSIKKEKNKSI